MRAIIFVAVFTISAAGPALREIEETPSELYDARDSIDRNPLRRINDKNNEIIENWPLNGYIHIEKSKGNNIDLEKNIDNTNSDELNSLDLFKNNQDEDDKNNLIDVDDDDSNNKSVFLAVLIEFVASIAEKIMAVYKS